jgi:ribose 5-phosphate isomerase
VSDDDLKREAASAAVDRYVQSGMVVGLGTGTTATFAVRRIGELLASGELRDVRGVPTSSRTMDLANELGIPLATLSEARASLGCQPELRMDQTDPVHPFVTDGGHYTADCTFESIPDPASLEVEIKRIPGALECGLFVNLARAAIIAGENGVIEASPR